MAVYIVTTLQTAPGGWHDNVEGVERDVGSSFETDQKRAEQIKQTLPDFVDIKPKAEPKKAAPKKIATE